MNRGPKQSRAAHLGFLVSGPRPVVIDVMKREVAAELEVEITAPTMLEFQIAVASHPNTEVSERLSSCWMETWSSP